MNQASAEQLLANAAAAEQRGALWESACLLREALQTNAALGERWSEGIAIARRIGDESGALGAAQRLLQEAGNSAKNAFVLAEALTDAGQAARAVALLLPYARSAALSPDQQFKLARMLMFAGDIEQAQARTRALIGEHAGNPVLWERIAQTKRFAPGDSDIDAMRRLCERWPAGKPAGHAAIAAALAKAFVDIGEDELADRYLREKADANRARYPFAPELLEAAVRDIERWCAQAAPDPDPEVYAGSDRPVFILGPARSGTSLLDQIFARHSRIAGGGELQHLWLATRELGDCSSSQLDAGIERMKSHDAGVFGRRYLALADERFGPGARFTDKLLSNVYRVRAIRRALPGAHIVYLRRNALDIAWSCWRAQFDAQSAWSNTPEGIALYIRGYRRAMDAWCARYPQAIVALDYEQLTRDPDREIPRVLESCALADEPATREPQYARRAVATLSHAQVREPIHARSVGAGAAFPRSTHALHIALEAAGVGIS